MRFVSRVFQLAKDPEHPAECQDAWASDGARGVAVIADGVSSAIFSGPWATILVESVLAEAPEPGDPQRFAGWLDQRRQAWSARIDTTGLAWFQKAKLPMGAFSTLLWVRIEPTAEDQPGAFGALRLAACAIGDSCLLHVRRGELVRSFPVKQSDEFQANPLVLGSVDLGRDQLLQFCRLDEFCYADDLLVLCTDAVAEWGFRREEAGEPVNWEQYWEMSPGRWQDEIARLRHEGQMRYDDATLVLLRVMNEQPAPIPTRSASEGRGSGMPTRSAGEGRRPPSRRERKADKFLKWLGGG